MKIRAARPGDSERISQLLCELSTKFITGDFSPEGAQYLLETMTPDAIRTCIQSGYEFHVAEGEDGRLAGVVGVKDNTHLYHLFVAEQYQRQGLARMLWQTAMQSCLARGNPGEFTVHSSAYARGAYKALGFTAHAGAKEKGGVVFYPMNIKLDSLV
jgi:GNAT superfamily N-acetyltransferase